MKRLALVLFLIVIVASSLSALPRYALIVGTKCGSCHVNPTGGQMRSEYGTNYSLSVLTMRTTRMDSTQAPADSAGADSTAEAPKTGGDDFSFNPKLTDNITIGGDFRGQFLYDGGSKTTAFQGMAGWFYGSIQLGKKVTLYFKQDIVNPTYAPLNGPEIFSIVKITPSVFVKGGIMLPDYGWRIDDHTAYTRGGDLGFISSLGYNPGLIFIPNYKDIGAEAGWMGKNLSLTAGLFNGNGNSNQISFSKEKAYSVKGEFMGDIDEATHVRVGASGYGFKDFHMAGVHAGVGHDVIAVYGEVDWTRNRLALFDLSPTVRAYSVITDVQSMAMFAEADYRVMQGAWATVRYDMFDPQLGVTDVSTGAATNAIKRLMVGAEFFPYSFVEIRPQYRINIETPSVDNDVALVQFHYWF